MEERDLKLIIREAVAKVIADMVVQRLEAMTEGASAEKAPAVDERPGGGAKRLLAVFAGSRISAEEGVAQVAELRQKGWRVDLFFSYGAHNIMDVPAAIERISPDRVLEVGNFVPEKSVGEYDCIAVPSMTINTAAKLANCISDTVTTRLIMTAILMQKPVYIAVDGCCPLNENRKVAGHFFNDKLREKLSGNLEAIKGFGARLTSCGDLCRKISGTDKVPKRGGAEAAGGGRRIPGRLIGERQIKANAGYKTLVLDRNAQVTQLAKDLARRLNINLIFEK